VKPETIKLKAHIAKIVEPLRLRCEFILRNGDRAGKKCGKRAKKTSIKGIGNMKSSLCWRHRKLLQKEYIADIIPEDS
jgi:hypothetical protein